MNDFGFKSFNDIKTPNDDSGFISFYGKQNKKEPESKESNISSAFRYAAQIPLGLAQVSTPGILSNLMHMIAMGDINDPEEIDRIREIAKREGVPFDEESFKKAGENALSYFPTVSNLARIGEENTGLPLQPKTLGQEALQLGASLGSSKPKLKQSGLTEKKFESVNKPTKISQGKFEKINEAIEEDFRKIADKIIEQTPIEETRDILRKNPAYKSEVAEGFQEVEKLAESIPNKVHTHTIKETLGENVKKKLGTGFSPTEYDKDFNKFIKKIAKDTPDKDINAIDLVKQYRKNNKALSEIYDPSKNYAYNRANKDAILEYNKAITDTIEKTFPNSEFSNLFRLTNKQWAEISDAEAINKFIDGIADKKINFDKAKKFFDNENIARPFKRSLGEKGFNDFKQLMKDLTSSEKAYKMLKVAEKKGFEDLAKSAGAYFIHPKLGFAKSGFDVAKGTWNYLINSLLDKPKNTLILKDAIKDLKNGKFKSAEQGFKSLQQALQLSIPAKEEV